MTARYTITSPDQLRLDEGRPHSAAQRILALARSLNIRLQPGAYFNDDDTDEEVGLCCVLGMLASAVHQSESALPFGDGPLTGEDLVSSYLDSVGYNYGQDSLLVFIADHVASITMEQLERIEKGFENDIPNHRDDPDWPTLGLDVGQYGEDKRWGTLTPSMLSTHDRAIFKGLDRYTQIGYYLRTMVI